MPSTITNMTATQNAISLGHTSSSSSTAGATITFSHTISTETLLIVAYSSVGPTVTSMTYGAQSLTKAVGIVSTASFSAAEIWYLKSPSAGTATVTVNKSGSGDSGAGGISFNNADVAGVDTRVPDSYNSVITNATTVTLNTTTVTNNCWTVAVANRTFGANLTPTETQFFDTSNGSDEQNGSYSGPHASIGSFSHTWSTTSTSNAVAIISIAPTYNVKATLVGVSGGAFGADITVGNTSNLGSQATGPGPTTWNHTIGSETILVVGISILALSAVGSVTALTYNGVALTKLEEALRGAVLRTEMWYLLSPPTGIHAISVTISNSNIWSGEAIGLNNATVANIPGYATVPDKLATDQNTTTTSTISMTPNSDRCFMLSFTAGFFATTATPSPAAANSFTGASAIWLSQVQGPITPASSTTHQTTWDSSRAWAQVSATFAPTRIPAGTIAL